jgi:hypothetical protein
MYVDVIASFLLAKIESETSFRAQKTLLVLGTEETIVSTEVESEEGTLVLFLRLCVELNDCFEIDSSAFLGSVPSVTVTILRLRQQ